MLVNFDKDVWRWLFISCVVVLSILVFVVCMNWGLKSYSYWLFELIVSWHEFGSWFIDMWHPLNLLIWWFCESVQWLIRYCWLDSFFCLFPIMIWLLCWIADHFDCVGSNGRAVPWICCAVIVCCNVRNHEGIFPLGMYPILFDMFFHGVMFDLLRGISWSNVYMFVLFRIFAHLVIWFWFKKL